MLYSYANVGLILSATQALNLTLKTIEKQPVATCSGVRLGVGVCWVGGHLFQCTAECWILPTDLRAATTSRTSSDQVTVTVWQTHLLLPCAMSCAFTAAAAARSLSRSFSFAISSSSCGVKQVTLCQNLAFVDARMTKCNSDTAAAKQTEHKLVWELLLFRDMQGLDHSQ